MGKTRTGRLLPQLLLGVLMVLVAETALAAEQQEVVTLDPNHTAINFTLSDVLHTVHGTFRLKSGVIRFDPATGAASGELVVDAASGNSGNRFRDRKMNREILESVKFPEIVFIPQKVVGNVPAQGNSQVNVQGIFQIHGAGHPLLMTIPISVQGNQIKVSTHFVVPYQSWGLRNPSTLFLRVGNTVQIDITSQGSITKN